MTPTPPRLEPSYSSPAAGTALIALLGVVLAGGRPTAAKDQWPQFRGPTGQGVSDARALPLTWGEDKNVTWKTPVHGRAWSSPVVAGNQVWLTTAAEDGRQLFAVCLDRDTGKVVHDLKLFDVPVPQYAHPFNSYGSPTPAVEGGRVYVTFGSPGTACLEAATGKVLWERRDFVCNHFRGAGSSPLIYQDLLILNYDGSDYQFVAALDKNTGKTVWKTDRSVDYQDAGPDGKPRDKGDYRKAFSTDRVAAFPGANGGKPFLISVGSKCIYGYDPATGAELWRFENRTAHSAGATPVIGPDLIYVAAGFGQNEVIALRPGGQGVLGDAQVAWRLRKGAPGKPSVLLGDGLLYAIDDAGIASCLEPKTGQEVWHARLKGNYSASPLYAAGRVYFFSEDGRTTVAEAGRQLKVLAENQLGDGFMASPAVAGESLFLRSRTNVYRIDAEK